MNHAIVHKGIKLHIFSAGMSSILDVVLLKTKMNTWLFGLGMHCFNNNVATFLFLVGIVCFSNMHTHQI